MPDDRHLHGVLDRLADIDLEGPPHEHQRQQVRARLFGGEPPRRRIGRFEVLGELGRGGMGIVLRARDDQLDREVALKVMKESLRSEHGQRLLREAQALAKLSHPNVVQVYEVGTTDEHLFIAMQRVQGTTLARWQRQRRPWAQCLDVYLQAGRGLAAAHAQGLVHRDFKPSNCMLDEQGVVRVLDFGLAREEGAWLDDGTGPMATAESSVRLADTGEREAPASGSSGASVSMLRQRLTQTGSIMGTRAYMAPEQLAEGYADARSDQFSFCVALYEAICGQRPFDDQTPSVVMDMADGVHHRPWLPPAGSDAPRWLLRVVGRGLCPRPEDRWPSMPALLDELERRRRPGRGRAVAWASGLLGVGLALGGSAWLVGAPGEPPCEAVRSQQGGVWGAPEREAVRATILASQRPHAAHTWATVQDQLDRHARRLEDAYVEACEAGRAFDGAPPPSLEARGVCLDQRRADLRDRVALLAGFEEPEIDRAVEFVARLPSIERCDGVDAVAGPRGSAAAALHEQLGGVRRLAQLGRHDEGLARLESLAPRLEGLGEPALRAEALLLEGTLRASKGEHEDALDRLRRAHHLSVSSAADSTAVEAMAGLVHLLGVEQAKTEAALWLGSTAEALATRPGVDPLHHARILVAMAQVRSVRGDHAQARRGYLRAIERIERHLGPEHIALVEAVDGHGTAADAQGDLDQAEASYRRALALRERWQGAEHPDTAYQRVQLGVVLARRGQQARAASAARATEYYRQAIEQYRRALAVYEASLRPDHRRIAHARSNLGSALVLLGRPREAEVQLRVAIEHWTLEHGPDHPRVAMARFNLGKVLTDRARPLEALAEYDRALEILLRVESTPASLRLVAKTLRRQERLLLATGREHEVDARYRRALERLEARGVALDLSIASLRERLADAVRDHDR